MPTCVRDPCFGLSLAPMAAGLLHGRGAAAGRRYSQPVRPASRCGRAVGPGSHQGQRRLRVCHQREGDRRVPAPLVACGLGGKWASFTGPELVGETGDLHSAWLCGFDVRGPRARAVAYSQLFCVDVPWSQVPPGPLQVVRLGSAQPEAR